MILTRRKVIASALAMAAAAALPVSRAWAAPTIVNVTLWDKGDSAINMMGRGPMRGMGMMQGKGKMSGKNMMSGETGMGLMGIDAAPGTAKAGDITFEVINKSKDLVHEMVIGPVADESRPLPYDKTILKVNEDAAGHLGEVAELESGQSGALRLTLSPGKYILYCNIPGHYALGMWTIFTVTA